MSEAEYKKEIRRLRKMKAERDAAKKKGAKKPKMAMKKTKMAMKKTKLVKDEKGKKKFSKGEYMIRG